MNGRAANLLPASSAASYDFGQVRDTLSRFVNADILPCASAAVLVDGELAFQSCAGWADKERKIALAADHLFRVFSNTKLITSCAALLLVDDGLLDLDEPVSRHLPAFAGLRVLRPGATRLTDTEPARRPITARHLFTHTAGFSYARTRSGTLLGDAYDTHRLMLDASQSLEHVVNTLATLPLMVQPGTAWEYSLCTDVLARLIEVVSGERFDHFLKTRVFDPLGMRDTSFHVSSERRERLVGLYRSVHPDLPLRGGLERCDDLPYRGAYVEPHALLSGGGGLVSTLGDMVALMKSLVCARHALLSPASLNLLLSDQLPPDMSIRFPNARAVVGRGFSFAGAVTRTRTPLDPAGAEGEVQWGGIAGTHWWVSPATGSAAVIMTQRYMSFWHLFAFQARRDIYAALNGQAG